jgi:hypothetical protein
MAKEADMHTYEFTLYLANVDEATLEMGERLAAAGCDDATIGSSGGKVYVEFARLGEHFRDAIDSAIAAVREAGYEVSRVTSEEFEVIDAANAALS